MHFCILSMRVIRVIGDPGRLLRNMGAPTRTHARFGQQDARMDKETPSSWRRAKQ